MSAEASAEAVAEAVAEQRLPEGMLAEFCEEIFEMPVGDIPESRLKEIKWMETKAAIDYYGIGYSFEDPLESGRMQSLPGCGFRGMHTMELI